MSELDAKTRAVISEFVTDMIAALGQRLEAVVLYGSAAGGQFIAGRSDLNFMVVVESVDPEALTAVGRKLKGLRRKRIATPLVVDQNYIRRSLDTFPIEFADILAGHETLHGDDPFTGLSVKKEDLRLECEAELKRKLLALRQAVMEGQGKLDEQLIRRSFKSYLAVMRALLRYFEEEVPQNAEPLIQHIEQRLMVGLPSFYKLARIHTAGYKPTRDEQEQLIKQYLRDADSLALAVDLIDVESK